ncbi:MAG: SRPBCC family protein [Zetaproteobacteria bacterium]|nr:SRPBCC family protein [Zetaproteobacteria bacterium]
MTEISCSTQINASPQQVFKIISDIPRGAEIIAGIQHIEMLHDNGTVGVGTQWKETRIIFGQAASEEMTIIEFVPNSHYVIRGENHGCEYLSTLKVCAAAQGTLLSMDFKGRPLTLFAKVMDVLTGWLLKGNMTKMCQEDLESVKSYIEQQQDTR